LKEENGKEGEEKRSRNRIM
jgi:hypothetical protein